MVFYFQINASISSHDIKIVFLLAMLHGYFKFIK